MFELWATSGGREYRFQIPENQECYVGQHSRNSQKVAEQFRSDFAIENPMLSGRHFSLFRTGNQLKILRRMEPTPTKYGILFREKLSNGFELVPGDTFSIEQTDIVFEWRRLIPITQKPSPSKEPSEARTLEEVCETLMKWARFRNVPREPESQLLKLFSGMTGFFSATWVEVAEGSADVVTVRDSITAHLGDQSIPLYDSQLLHETIYSKLLSVRVEDPLSDSWPELSSHDPVSGAAILTDMKWSIHLPYDTEMVTEDYRHAIIVRGSHMGTPQLKTMLVYAANLSAAFLEGAQRMLFLERRVNAFERFVPKSYWPLVDRDVQPIRTPGMTILFSDMRDFSRVMEENENDLVKFVSKLQNDMDKITEIIAATQGRIGYLQGDAVMAFWGWPDSRAEAISEAVKAAMTIANKYKKFKKSQESISMSDFHCGVGLAQGDAVAGLLGTDVFRKIDVLGGAVNRAARLESLTKRFQALVVVDQAIGRDVRKNREKYTDICRTRFLGRYCVAGSNKPEELFELLPADSQEDRPNCKPKLRIWEDGVKAFCDGNWEQAVKRINESYYGIATDDPVAREILNFINGHNIPPNEVDGSPWNGAIKLQK